MIKTSPQRKLHFYATLMALFVLAACDLMNEPKAPTWTNSIEFPLIQTSINLDDLKDQDNIISQLYPDGSDTMSIYAYADTTVMDSQAVGDQLSFDDISQSFAQSVDDVTVTGSTIDQSSAFEAVGVDPIQEVINSPLGQIELSDIPTTSTDPFQLDEIVPDVKNISDGTVTSIPAGDLEPVEKPFEFTDFSSADFAGGSLDITVNNNMVIALGSPINIQLQEITAGDTINIPGGLVTWNTPIPSGTNSTRSLDLTGMTLPGNILILVTGSSVGSEGNDITIDAAAKTSSFYIDISGSNLLVSSATAKVPSQAIAENGNIALADSENKIQSAVIKTGSLSIAIDNAMEVASDLTITIASLQDASGVAFTSNIHIPALQTVTSISDISNYSLEMSTDQQEVLYNYDIVTVSTGESLVTLSETDEVAVTISLYGANVGDQLFFNEITGIIEAQNIEEAGDISIESDSKLLVADISSGTIAIDIDNQVNRSGFQGLPTIFLTIPELVDANSQALNGSLTLQPSPIQNVLNFNLADYSLVFPDTANQVLTYTTLVTTPTGELGKYGLEDSIIVDIQVSDMEFASVTGYFTQDALVDSSTITLDEATKLTEAIFEAGDFALTMTNRIGVVADVEFQIDEFINRTTLQPLSMSFRLADISTPQVTNLDLSDYKLKFDTAIPGEPQEINYVSSVSLPSDEEMTLTFGDSIVIDVNITDLSMSSITGIIERDTLIIEESEQIIDMPDMVDDVQFEQVNIDIDFNSTFEIPIELTLNLSATDSLGNTEDIVVVHNLTPEDDIVHINAASLLNIHPESIVTNGQAIISDGVSQSRIAKGQAMTPIMYLNVPLSLIIDDSTFIDQDVTSLDAPLPQEDTYTVESVDLFAEVTSTFEFGVSVVVLVSPDSMAFDSVAIAAGTAPMADTLLVLDLLPNENTDPITGYQIANPEPRIISLTNDKITLLEEDLFLQPEVQLLGRTDDNGDNPPSRLFTTDSLSLKTWGKVSYTIIGEEL